jgi:hypothetical protein
MGVHKKAVSLLPSTHASQLSSTIEHPIGEFKKGKSLVQPNKKSFVQPSQTSFQDYNSNQNYPEFPKLDNFVVQNDKGANTMLHAQQ